MKIAEGFLLRKIVDDWIVVFVGENTVKKHSILSLNESSALLWESLETGSDEDALTAVLCGTYLVDEETARMGVLKFLHTLDEMGILLKDQ